MRITTGAGNGAGYIEVKYMNVGGTQQVISGYFNAQQVVVDTCDVAPTAIQVRGTDTDGWSGTIEFSNNGGSSYEPMLCPTCGVGTGSDQIVVDGNADTGSFASLTCFNGAVSTVDFPTDGKNPILRSFDRSFKFFLATVFLPCSRRRILLPRQRRCHARVGGVQEDVRTEPRRRGPDRRRGGQDLLQTAVA